MPELVFAIAFVVGILVTVLALLAAALDWVDRVPLAVAASVLGAAAAAGWIAFAFVQEPEIALSAAGLVVCTVAGATALPLQRALRRARRLDAEVDRVARAVEEFLDERIGEAEAELGRVVSRSLADSVSTLTEEERKLREERRRELVQHEREAHARLTDALAATQSRVETRLAGWGEDLERAQQNLIAQFDRLTQRQRQLIAEAEARVAADVERLEGTTEEQRASTARLREELGKAAEQIVSDSTAELEQHAAERRRALHELNERLRRRERELADRIEREETEATQRIQAGFADLERRALDQLERATERAWGRYAEAAEQQFVKEIRAAREEAARRLSRELDRAVEAFSREAATVLAERLAQVGDAGAQRLEKRMTAAAAGIERQRDELFATLEERVAQAEGDLRRRLHSIVADADAERAVLEARLHEFGHRVDEAVAASRKRLAALEAERVR